MFWLINGLTAFVALQHFGFMILEIFYWNKPLGRKIFQTEEDFANKSWALASNQGLYNGFLASGLSLTLVLSHTVESFPYRVFFLACVVVAGIFGALTVSRRILWIQSLPALITLVLYVIYFSRTATDVM